jgi:hypothetical protein
VPSYDEGTFTATATGMTTTVSGTATYVKIGRQVTLMLPDLTGTSNATTFTVTGLPAPLLPASSPGTARVATLTQDTGVFAFGFVQLDAGTGAISVNKSNFAAWGTGGAKAMYASPVTYLVD